MPIALFALGVACPAAAQSEADLAAMRTAHAEVMKLKTDIDRDEAALAAFRSQGDGTTDPKEALAKFRRDSASEMERARAALAEAFAGKQRDAANAHQGALDAAAARRAQARSAWKSGHDARVAAHNQFIVNGDATAALKNQLSSIDSEVGQLGAQKARALDEIRKGLFCSKCGKSKSEIERQTGKSFEEHLTEVSGTAISQSAAFASTKEKEFDDRIANALRSKGPIEQQIAAKRDQFVTEVNARVKKLEADVAAYDQNEAATAQADTARAETARTNALTQADGWKQGQEAQLAARQAKIDAEIKARQNEIDAREKAFKDEVTRREATVAALKGREPQLSSAYDTVAKRVSQQALVKDVADRRGDGAGVVAQRQGSSARLGSWIDADYAHARAAARFRSNQIADWASVTAARAKADLSERAAWAERAMLGDEGDPNSLRGRAASWGTRASAQFQALPATLRQRIEKNVDTLGKPVNLARATVRQSLGTLRSGITNAVLNRLSGISDNLPAGISAAIDAAKPNVGATVKAELMPTIEDGLVEGYVGLQAIQQNREITGVERAQEKSFGRVRFFGWDIRKLGDNVLQTTDEVFTAAMQELDN